MASQLGKKILGVFVNTEKLAKANQKYREQKARNDAHNQEVRFALTMARARNKAAFLAELDANTAKRNARLKAAGVK